MKCPNCGSDDFEIVTHDEPFMECSECGWFVCTRCDGSGAVDAPFSGSDPSCIDCDGEGGFDPNAGDNL